MYVQHIHTYCIFYVNFIFPKHIKLTAKSLIRCPLSGQLGYQGSAHLEELHGVVPSDEALSHLDYLGLLDGGGHLEALGLLLNQGLEVQQVTLVVHLVQLQ